MDARAEAEAHLVDAERHITQAEMHILEQTERLERLRAQGQDTATAATLLTTMRAMLVQHRTHRDTLARRLANLNAMVAGVGPPPRVPLRQDDERS